MNVLPRILVAGIGNSIRSDDGIGPYIAQCLEDQKLNGVTTTSYHQLTPELIEEFISYDIIVLADAAVNEEAVAFYLLEEKTVSPASASHHINASLLLSLSKQLYQKKLTVYVCAVQAHDFSMGWQLSANGKINADAAVVMLSSWISQQTQAVNPS